MINVNLTRLELAAIAASLATAADAYRAEGLDHLAADTRHLRDKVAALYDRALIAGAEAASYQMPTRVRGEV